MNIMAIEDGLVPLTNVSSASKYLQQCKVTSSVKTLANSWLLNYISSSLKSHDREWRWQCTIIGEDADQRCHDPRFNLNTFTADHWFDVLTNVTYIFKFTFQQAACKLSNKLPFRVSTDDIENKQKRIRRSQQSCPWSLDFLKSCSSA